MPGTMADASESATHGSIVAFEGLPETISTQLRLLPTSPQILILPSVQCYLPTDDADEPPAAHEYIRMVHDAAKARNKTALSFLKPATSTNKRLVFMNGGTPSAQCLCIKHIMRYETEGDDAEAEAMFNFLIKEGLLGLESQAKKWNGEFSSGKEQREREHVATADKAEPYELASPFSDEQRPAGDLQRAWAPAESDEDPITRAMRAAEALDRQTANLQPSNDLDLTLAARRRSVNLPMYGYSDNFGDSAPFFVFGAGRKEEDRTSVAENTAEDELAMAMPPRVPRFSVTHYEDQYSEAPPPTGRSDPQPSPSCVGESYGPTFLHSPFAENCHTSKSDCFDIRSPSDVVFGEASLVDMRTSRNPVTRVRSLDRIDKASPVRREIRVLQRTAEGGPESSRGPSSSMVVPDASESSSAPINPTTGPRVVAVGAGEPGVVNIRPVPSVKKRKSHESAYVDRGTDAQRETGMLESFVRVLPIMETLVVYLREDVPDVLLEKAVRNSRVGAYPVLSSSPDGSETETVNEHLPSTPKSQSTRDSDETPKAAGRNEPAVASPSVDVDGYDPFAFAQKPPESDDAVLPMKVERPPTPVRTPTPSMSDTKEEKFHDFKVAGNQTAVAIQNSLRSVLSTYFPPGTRGYNQFSFPLLPELDGLWRPIFREAEPGSPRDDNRRTDQILAIGVQKGVKKEFSSSVISLMDKLGSNSRGLSRSGRLDFRYLLANAIQAFTSQPLANQTSDNPFSNPYLLATLIIPHLETYLALHSEVRYLLLEYPPDHISTVLALQKLVGVDLMKVAQIVDSESTDLRPFTHIRGASISSDTKPQSPLGKPVGSATEDSRDLVHKANFLLTSGASDEEIANLIATVKKILMEVSQFYAPEETQRAPSADTRKPVRKSGPPPLTSSFSPLAKANSTRSQNPETPAVTSPPASVRPQSGRPPSVSETLRSVRTARTGRSTKTARFRRRPLTRDGAESFVTFDPAEDSDYDMEERRLMPMFMQKPSRKSRPNSRKALKFLGLA